MRTFFTVVLSLLIGFILGTLSRGSECKINESRIIEQANVECQSAIEEIMDQVVSSVSQQTASNVFRSVIDSVEEQYGIEIDEDFEVNIENAVSLEVSSSGECEVN